MEITVVPSRKYCCHVKINKWHVEFFAAYFQQNCAVPKHIVFFNVHCQTPLNLDRYIVYGF